MEPRELLAFYGDDFTGASANLMECHRRGLKGRLYVTTPTLDEVAGVAGELDVLGVAGISRSLAPSALRGELRPAFELFRALRVRVVQYKICATFDSSPTRGSFGAVLELAREVFGDGCIPILAAHPAFQRYTAFGNHFAVYDGEVHRLDRHPSMSRHPATPMGEADLRRHLAMQTALDVGLFDVARMRAAGVDGLAAALRDSRAAAMLCDAMEPADLVMVADAVRREARARTVFTLSAHGFAAGWAESVRRDRTGAPLHDSRPPSEVDALLVLSGSCSPRTARQIEDARARGWRAMRLPLQALASESVEGIAARMAGEVLDALDRKQSVVLYAAAGPDDDVIASGRELFETMGAESSAVIGRLLAALAGRVFERRMLPRLMLAGGDTSSQIVRALGVRSLSIDAIHPDSTEAMMRMHAPGQALDGVQLLMKAGQNGSVDYFEQARIGTQWR